MDKNAGILSKFLLLLIVLLAISVLLIKTALADSAVNSVNVTLIINSTSIIINVSNSLYETANTPSVFVIQQNFTVYFFSNTTNITFVNQTATTNITCNNTTISLSCSCPSCPSVNANCTSASEVSLNNETKTEFFNHYITSLGAKIEESSNKVSQDILFKLEPTKAQLEECKQFAFNSSLKEQEAYRLRDKFASDNIALTTSLENERSEKKTLQVVALAFLIVGVIIILSLYGFWERAKGYMRGFG